MKAAVANGMAEALRKPEPIQFDPTTDDHDDGSNVYNRVTNCFYEIMKSMVKQMLVDIIRECNNWTHYGKGTDMIFMNWHLQLGVL